jgi:hypothetical protein
VKDAGLAKDCRSCCTEDVDDAGSVKAASASVPRPPRAPGPAVFCAPCHAPSCWCCWQPLWATAYCVQRRVADVPRAIACIDLLCLMVSHVPLAIECMCHLSLHHTGHWIRVLDICT